MQFLTNNYLNVIYLCDFMLLIINKNGYNECIMINLLNIFVGGQFVCISFKIKKKKKIRKERSKSDRSPHPY